VRSLPLLAALLACAAVAGCGANAQSPAAHGGPIDLKVRPAAMEIGDRDADRIGALTYAGGLVLSSAAEGFGGFSGLDVQPDGRFVSQTDAGGLFRGRILLDRTGRLAGIGEPSLSRLVDTRGRPYADKFDADAEDVTFLPDGGFAVSFEQQPRVQAYDGEGPARMLGVPAEAAGFRSNGGLEALTAWTDDQGRPRLVEGAEDGRIWSCDMAGRDCVKIVDGVPEADFSLTSLDAIPDGRGMVAVYRAFDLIRGMRALVAWVRPGDPQPVVVLARLAPPANVDNMEGVAALRNADGSIRIYLISDDNFSPIQRTLLLAFDWRDDVRRTP
jgi:hypothetical protein